MNFTYKAISSEGVVSEGEYSGESRDELYEFLKRKGLTLVSADEAKGGSKNISFAWFTNRFGRVKEEEKIIFARNLGVMIEAGLSLARALTVIERQSKNPKFKKIVSSINEILKEGQPFSDGLAKFPKVFSSLFISMVRAGEESGKLVEALLAVADQMERSHKLKKKIRGAMIYPGIIMFAMVVIGILMLIFVVPTLTATFKELKADLPLSTQLIIHVSDFLAQHTLVSIAGIIAVVAGFMALLRTKKGKRWFEYASLRMPIVGPLVKEVNAARTASTLSSLLSSGVDIVRAIEITHEVVQNSYYRTVLDEMKGLVQTGGAMSEVFKKHEDLYPTFVGEMTAVGEETGKLTELLGRVAVYYEEDVEQKTKDMSTIIEPFLMILIGAVVGFFAVSMISPMYSLSNSI